VLAAAIQRMRAERALREARDEFEAVIEASPVPIVAYDARGGVTLWNRAAERVFGWQADEVVGEILPIVPPEKLDEVHEIRDTVLAGGTTTGFETYRYDRHGRRVEVRISNAPVRDTDGAVRGVVALVEDVTEEQRAQQALRESEERLRLALEASQMGTWEWDVGSDGVTWSDNLEEVHALEPGSFGGTFESFLELVHPDDRASLLRALHEALDEGAGYDIEFRTVAPSGAVTWIAGQGHVIRDAEGNPGRMVGLARNITERKRREQGLAFLAEAAETLSTTLDYERTLADVARLAVPRLADCCVVDVLEEAGRVHQLAVVHVSPEKEELVRELERLHPTDPDDPGSFVGSVLRAGVPRLVDDTDDRFLGEVAADEAHREALRRLGLTSALIVPLIARGRTLGAITLLAGESGRRFDAGELALAADLGRHAALAVDNARLYHQRSHIAATLQRSLLPPRLPDIPGVGIAARYRPAGRGLEVGGDFYDAFEIDDARWGIVIGDVCGKGPEAAAVTGLTRHTIRAAAIREPSASTTLGALNAALLREYGGATFCTVAFGLLESTAGGGTRFVVACGGHPQPLLVRPDGLVRPIGSPGTLIGVFDDPEIHDEAVELHPGETVVLYTDGLVELAGEEAEAGEPALRKVLAGSAGLPAEEIARAVERWVASAGEAAPRDDIAFLNVQVEA
jgi:PAS domain S-box-containing protein